MSPTAPPSRPSRLRSLVRATPWPGLLAALLTTACLTDPGAEPTGPAPADAPATPAPTTPPDAAPPATAEPAPDAAPEGPDPATYGDQYLVILSSSREAGASPAGLATIEAQADLPSRVARLESGWYKQLMPCWEIVVAHGFDDLGEARAYSSRLEALGVDHYLKNAGAYTGPDPRVAAYCRVEATTAAAGTSALRFVVDTPAGLSMHLAAEPLLAERAMQGAPAPAPLDEAKTAWRAPLAVETVGDTSIGDRVALFDLASGTRAACSVRAFEALTLGQPHFGWYQVGEQDLPGCGEAAPFAALDCPASTSGTMLVAQPADAPAPALFVPAGELTEARLKPAIEAARADASFRSVLASAERDAAGGEGPLKQQFHGEIWRSVDGDRTLWVVRAELITGEGFAECGGPDVRYEPVGVFAIEDGSPRLVNAFEDLTWNAVLGVVELPTGVHLALTRAFGGRALVGPDGAVAATLDEAYCDCPC